MINAISRDNKKKTGKSKKSGLTAFKQGKAFVAFLTAGDPDTESTERYIVAMSEAGADLIEIGVPFSDPIAEGEVIQAANLRALKNDVSLDTIFELCKRVNKKITADLALLTYLNPVFNRGYDRFFRDCSLSGVRAVIIPDCPFEEQSELKSAAFPFGVSVISLIAPTSEERIKKIGQSADGFIYLVSSMGVTGMRQSFDVDIDRVMKQIRDITDTPVCLGFGISTPKQAAQFASHCDGVIVGSAIVKIIERLGGGAEEELRRYVSSMKAAVKSAE